MLDQIALNLTFCFISRGGLIFLIFFIVAKDKILVFCKRCFVPTKSFPKTFAEISLQPFSSCDCDYVDTYSNTVAMF